MSHLWTQGKDQHVRCGCHELVGGRVSAMTLIGKKKLHSDAHTTRFGKNMLAMQRRSDMVDLHLLKYLGSSLADFHISTLSWL